MIGINVSVSFVFLFVYGIYFVDLDGLVEFVCVVDIYKCYNFEKYYVYVVNICWFGD